ncbi:MAG: hypothetical protein QOI73_806 [Solirubrobacteraceae bacterium]|nr:hypothetical protein [Solirubrobacteraceae bacterium]
MPDQEGNVKGPGFTDTPDQAYKSGRPEDIQEGSLGAETGGPDAQVSRLTKDAGAGDEGGSAHVGGFAGQQADDSPDAGTVGDISGEGDPSPHAQYDTLKKDDAAGQDQGEGGLSVGEGAKDLAPGSLGNDGPDEVGKRGYGQQPDYDVHDDVDAKQAHPKTPSDMGNR